MLKAIETSYRGYRFRSRLEARWAVFFDNLGVKWVYEPEGYDLGALGWYLPDFWLPEWGCFAEVKPGRFTKEDWDKCATLPHICLILDGIPEVRFYAVADHDDPDCLDEYISNDHNSFWIDLCASKNSRRLWWAMYGDVQDSPEFIHAIEAARSARFEYGEHVGVEL